MDAFGLSGGTKKHITFRRILASLITVVAVLVSVWDRIDAQDLSLFPVVLAGLAGAIVGIQRALNGKINIYSGQHWTTSLLNFIMGTSFLLMLTAILIPANRYEFQPLPSGQVNKCTWWMPWRLQAMKDVVACDKLRGAGKQALIRGLPNGETRLE